MAISSSKGSKIDGNLPFVAGGSKSGKQGSGDEDDGSGEGFRVIQLGILNEVPLASAKVCVKHCSPVPLSLFICYNQQNSTRVLCS
jgi:hypothetical protein